MKFSASVLLVTATTVAANWQPKELMARQSTCDIGYTECGTGCVPVGYTCCPDESGGCPATARCDKGDNGEYGCCRLGRTCSGDGGVSTIGGGLGGSGGSGGDETSISIPNFTDGPSFTGGSGSSDGPSYTFGGGSDSTPTSGSGGSGGSGSLGGNDACLSAAQDLPPPPTPPPSVQSALASVGAEGACTFKPPKSLASDFSSYRSAVSSYMSENSAAVSKVQSACSSGETNNIPFDCKGSSGSGGSGGGSSAGSSLSVTMGAVVAFAAGVVAVAAL